MATESEIKTSAERFLARAKEFAWLGAAAAALVTAIWWATTYLNDKRLEYVKTFNEKQITRKSGTRTSRSSAPSIGDNWSWLSPKRWRRVPN